MEKGPTGSTLTHLEGGMSGLRYETDQLVGLDPHDQRPLLARYDLGAAARTLTPESLENRRSGGLWRWHEVLPVSRWESVIHLGEGATPLHAPGRLRAWLGASRLLVKRESLNPTGSFKARGMAVAVSRAAELGATHLVAPSAGNAGGALAAYAAARGVRATVVMPADAPVVNQLEVTIAGADLVLLEGLISDCGRLARAIAARLGAFDLSTLKEPYRVEGKKTMGFELAEQLNWQLPDAIVYPTGGGTGLVGMWKAFAEMEALGLVGGKRPRLYAVQAEGCAPIVRAFEAGQRFAAPWEEASTAAAGIRVPSAVGDFLILECLRGSGGGAITVSEDEMFAAQSGLAANGLGYSSLETSAAAAGLRRMVEQRLIDPDESVVLFDTGAGFKSAAPKDLSLPRPVPNDPDRWEGVIADLRD
ncbi:MAG TPA: threonine synthase [Candidatus Sulfotelmatobacter sp.]|nr:threonine synthase [Candidatus Sulfotelmatobacter sp.]